MFEAKDAKGRTFIERLKCPVFKAKVDKERVDKEKVLQAANVAFHAAERDRKRKRTEE